MELYKELYLYLFNKVTDAISSVDAGDVEKVKDILREAQIKCEEMYIESNEEPI